MLSPLDHALIDALRELSPGELASALERDILPLAGGPGERQALLDRLAELAATDERVEPVPVTGVPPPTATSGTATPSAAS